MSDLALDPATGDLEITSGRMRLCSGAEEVAQHWRTEITLFLGEWFLDRSLGIDYQGQILVKGARPSFVRTLLARASLRVRGIVEVLELRLGLDAATRVLDVRAEVLLEGGEQESLVISESLGGG